MQIGDLNLHVERLGSGPPLIAVHGGPGLNLEPFKPTLLKLGDRAEIVLYDQRGCGRSETGPSDLLCNLDTHIADLDSLRAILGFERISLLGHSYGAYLSIAYAAIHPRRVRRLILICPPAPRPETPEELHRWHTLVSSDARRQVSRINKSALPLDEKVNRRLRIMLPAYFARPEALQEFISRNIRVSGTVAEKCAPLLMQRDLRPAIADLTMPLNILAGAEDRCTPPEYAEEIAALASSARLEKMAGVGHFPFMERPDAFLEFCHRALAQENWSDDTAER